MPFQRDLPAMELFLHRRVGDADVWALGVSRFSITQETEPCQKSFAHRPFLTCPYWLFQFLYGSFITDIHQQ